MDPSAANPKGANPLRLVFLGALLFCLGACGCGPHSSEPPLPQVDYVKAKALSDAVAADLVRGDAKDLDGRLDVGFRSVVRGPEDLQKVLEKMYGSYGRPTRWVFRVEQPGVRTDGPWKRVSLSFFYAVQTTQYPLGRYFLKVEVVNAFSGGPPDVSGFGFFTFKDGSVPDYLK